MKTADWTVDLKSQTATHTKTGVVLEFSNSGAGAWDGKVLNSEALKGVPPEKLAKLMRTAGDAYIDALRRHQA